MAKSRRDRGRKARQSYGSKVVANTQKQREDSSGYGYLHLPKDVEVFKEPSGRVKLDIIPYMVMDEHHYDRDDEMEVAVPGSPWYKKPIFVHRNVGVDRDSVICLKTVGKKCPICEYRDQQLRDGVDRDDAIGRPGMRNLYVVIPKGRKHEGEMMIWDIAQNNFQKVLNEELEEHPEYGEFPSPTDGMTLNIRMNEESFAGNKYNEASRVDFEDRKNQYDEEIIDEAPNLDEIIQVLSYKELQKKFLAVEDEDLEQEDDDDTPPPSSRRSKRTKDTDAEEEDYGDEDDEPVQPTRRSRKAREEDEDDSEEEAKPSRRSRRKPKAGECPSGYEFGADWDDYDECADCPVYDACGERYDELEA